MFFYLLKCITIENRGLKTYGLLKHWRLGKVGKIEGLIIKNYGPFNNVIIGKTREHQNLKSLGSMVTFIGPSGNGKSTLADVFGFIADCLSMNVEEACDANNRGGYQQLVSQGTDGPIFFEIYYRETSNSRPITYELEIALDAEGRPYVSRERLRQRIGKYGWPRSFLNLENGKGVAFAGNDDTNTGINDDGSIEGEPTEVDLQDNRKLGIIAVGAMKKFERVEKFLSFLRSWYLCYFSPSAARMMETAMPNPHLNKDGSNINNVAQYMYRENKNDFERVLKDIKSKLPKINRIEPQRFDNGQMMLKFYEDGFKRPFYSQHMSDGTLKLFAYYLLLHESNPRQLIFIEEPENGLYHKYLSELAQEMKNSVGKGFSKQIFVTTHSPFFVNALSPEDVWMIKKDENGYSTIKRAVDFEQVKEMTDEEVLLGDLWYSEYLEG